MAGVEARRGGGRVKVLITGNQGYVGPCVVRHLRTTRPDAWIAGLDAGYFAPCRLTPQVLPEECAHEQFPGDVRDISARMLEGTDAVVHLAGISNDPVGDAFAAITHTVNCEASVALAEKARQAGVRAFVFASSCSVYGFAEDGRRSEGSPVNPLTAYAKSKVAAEQGLEPLAGERFVVTCLRFATACGSSPRLRLDLVLNDFVAGAMALGEIRILSDGTPWRPLIHVNDMARAVEWALERPASAGGPFLAVNAGSDEWNYQVRGLAEAVATAIPGTRISMNPDALPDRRSYRVSFELFRRLAPRHQPAVSLAESIAGLRAGLESAGAASPGFDPSGFIRLKTLMGLIGEGKLGQDLRWRWPAAAVVD
jgi:nucleoside-diphosphate-sugar epimerase